jgi:hypothetical protein
MECDNRFLLGSLWDRGFVYFDTKQRTWKIVHIPATRVLNFYHWKWQREDTKKNPIKIYGYDNTKKMDRFEIGAGDKFSDALITSLMSSDRVRDVSAVWAVPPSLSSSSSQSKAKLSVELPYFSESWNLDLKDPPLFELPRENSLFILPNSFPGVDIVLCSPPTEMRDVYKIQLVQISVQELSEHEKEASIMKAFGLSKR